MCRIAVSKVLGNANRAPRGSTEPRYPQQFCDSQVDHLETLRGRTTMQVTGGRKAKRSFLASLTAWLVSIVNLLSDQSFSVHQLRLTI